MAAVPSGNSRILGLSFSSNPICLRSLAKKAPVVAPDAGSIELLGQPLAEGATPPGRFMNDAVARALGENPVVALREVVCLSSCDHGCAAAISAPGKWTYLLGRLTPDMTDDLLAYAATYAGSKTGTVLPSKRPASLSRMIVGRVPDLGTERAA